MHTAGTETGRFYGVEMCFTELPKGADYMTTTNRAQMAAAIAAVDPNTVTVIEALSEAGKVLVRYTFKKNSQKNRKHTRESFDKHLKQLARSVRKTPAAIWR